jgi:hypothetical protein
LLNRVRRGAIYLSNEMEEVKRKYSYEINLIESRLRYLEQGLITELTRADMHGYLSTNIQKLRKELNELFSKVINKTDSVNDEMGVLFENISKS